MMRNSQSWCATMYPTRGGSIRTTRALGRARDGRGAASAWRPQRSRRRPPAQPAAPALGHAGAGLHQLQLRMLALRLREPDVCDDAQLSRPRSRARRLAWLRARAGRVGHDDFGLFRLTRSVVMLREGGASSNHGERLCYWIARFRAMTAGGVHQIARWPVRSPRRRDCDRSNPAAEGRHKCKEPRSRNGALWGVA
jgi:hypothetical protein